MAGWSIESRSIGITKCSLFTRNLLLPCDLARAFIINVRRNRETRLNRECIEPCPDFYHQPNSKYDRLSSLRVNRRKVPLSNIRSNVAQTDGSRVNFSRRGQTCSAILSSCGIIILCGEEIREEYQGKLLIIIITITKSRNIRFNPLIIRLVTRHTIRKFSNLLWNLQSGIIQN